MVRFGFQPCPASWAKPRASSMSELVPDTGSAEP